MPGSYLATKGSPVFTSEWQAWVFIGVLIAGIVTIAIVVWKTRKL